MYWIVSRIRNQRETFFAQNLKKKRSNSVLSSFIFIYYQKVKIKCAIKAINSTKVWFTKPSSRICKGSIYLRQIYPSYWYLSISSTLGWRCLTHGGPCIREDFLFILWGLNIFVVVIHACNLQLRKQFIVKH